MNPFIAKSLVTMFFIGLVVGVAFPAQASVFNPETFMLKNGLQVVVIPNHRAPVVTHMVWYRVGSADEEANELGIAHFLEHLMFKGTRNRQKGEFSKIVARNGGQENAFTSKDYTAYHQTIAVDHLELLMEMEADRMTNLVITPQEVEPERLVVLEERRSRVENNPSSILGEHSNAALFLSHPYRNPVIGWKHNIESLSIERILAFYKRWYTPNNAILVVAGDITAAQLKPLAKKYYGKIPRQPETVRTRAKEPPQLAERRVTLRDKRVLQPSWRRTYLAPGMRWGNNVHTYPLEVLSNIIGSGASSLFYQSLVVKQKLAVSAGAHYSGDNRGPGRFIVYASPMPGVAIKKLQAAVEAEITLLMKNGVTADELNRAKSRMNSEAIYARDSLSGGARVIGSALAVGLSIDDVERWPKRIAAVTSAQILNAIKAIFDTNQSVTGVLLPASKF
jgi:zinc protease